VFFDGLIAFAQFLEEGYETLQTLSAGLKPMQPVQLHWAPRHGVRAGCSVLPDTP